MKHNNDYGLETRTTPAKLWNAIHDCRPTFDGVLFRRDKPIILLPNNGQGEFEPATCCGEIGATCATARYNPCVKEDRCCPISMDVVMVHAAITITTTTTTIRTMLHHWPTRIHPYYLRLGVWVGPDIPWSTRA